jgi:hypothetical protein
LLVATHYYRFFVITSTRSLLAIILRNDGSLGSRQRVSLREVFVVGIGVGRCGMCRRYVISHIVAPRAYFLRRKDLHSAALLFEVPRLGAESTTPRLEEILENTSNTLVCFIVFVVTVAVLVIVVAIVVDVLVVCHVFGTEWWLEGSICARREHETRLS